jgi:hypothetical protein
MTMDLEQAMTYLDFVVERHKVFERRQAGEQPPWTEDQILLTHKFTNCFRVLDYGSQFWVTDLMVQDDPTPKDVMARAILYRHTNRPAAWIALRNMLGRYPLFEDMQPWLADTLCDLRDNHGLQIFSGAYMILAERQTKGVDKARGVVTESRRIAEEAWPAFEKATSIEERYDALHEPKGMGDFMAMQTLTDYGYSGLVPDEENQFVVAGPGAHRGAKAIGLKFPEALSWAHEQFCTLDDAPLLEGRPLSLMDIQNTFCEFSKYARFASRPPKQSLFEPAHPGVQPAPVLPPHWKERR